MYKILRPLFFLLSAERAHYVAMGIFSTLVKIPGLKQLLAAIFKPSAKDSHTLMGLEFKNKVGLAAGFDKNAKWLEAIKVLGFGHVEVGTVTPKPQAGNDKPRLFRLPADKALINRMGFNNEGIEVMIERLKKRPAGLIVGGNIGKNKITPNEEALGDYMTCFTKIYPYVDYIVVNVSSPNTPGLRALQDKTFLSTLFTELFKYREAQTVYKPVLLKIAPDMADEGFKEIAEVLIAHKVDGVVATNTTIDRSNLITSNDIVEAIGAGGLSGKPLTRRSAEVISTLRQYLPEEFPVIGVGGVFNKADMEEKIKAGANLVQVYTGFIYEGPAIVKKLLK